MNAVVRGSGVSRRSLVIGVTAIVLVPLGMAALMFKNEKPEPKRVQTIAVLRLPPPPPPPKPAERPPDPPKIKDEVKVVESKPLEEPKQAAAEPPPGPLGLDAQGSGPGDGFGLAGRPGGRDITLTAKGGGGGMAFSFFANSTARHVAQELARDERLRTSAYRIELMIWLDHDGRIERYELARGTGDAQMDTLIRDGLARITPLRQAVPEGLPQPMRIRVTSADS